MIKAEDARERGDSARARMITGLGSGPWAGQTGMARTIEERKNAMLKEANQDILKWGKRQRQAGYR